MPAARAAAAASEPLSAEILGAEGPSEMQSGGDREEAHDVHAPFLPRIYCTTPAPMPFR